MKLQLDEDEDTETEDELEAQEGDVAERILGDGQVDMKLEPAVVELVSSGADEASISHLSVEPMATTADSANEGGMEMKPEVNASMSAVAEDDEGLTVQKMAEEYLDIATQAKNAFESATRAQRAGTSRAVVEKMRAKSLMKELKNMATTVTQRVSGDLRNGLFMNESAMVQFSEATVLMVSTITINEPTNTRHDWLVKVLQGLNSLLKSTDRSKLATPLLSIQECCLTLKRYCFRSFSAPVGESHDATQTGSQKQRQRSIDATISSPGSGVDGDLGGRITSLLSELVRECDSLSRQNMPVPASFINTCHELSRCMDHALQLKKPPLIENLPQKLAKLRWFDAQVLGWIPASLMM
ncbi:hypothetical protein BBJ28_00024079 [Nothophytophthora sp. Chile5]|nr:hypothetical protein BBJ28_00024079 [Nothophytophthora sp. Chile5]